MHDLRVDIWYHGSHKSRGFVCCRIRKKERQVIFAVQDALSLSRAAPSQRNKQITYLAKECNPIFFSSSTARRQDRVKPMTPFTSMIRLHRPQFTQASVLDQATVHELYRSVDLRWAFRDLRCGADSLLRWPAVVISFILLPIIIIKTGTVPKISFFDFLFLTFSTKIKYT